ncbi:MAG TPA: ABC transporter ATP-binding protein [Gemmatimonadaceae bacterium]|nr:ABC transporter ATP-binding protein [Gemmatimonadaceae bacterium]
MIDVAGLSARAGTFTLTDVSFRIPAGGYGVVIGPAGAGKTTLLEVLAGVIAPTSGTVRLSGQDMRGVPPEQRGIGLVYQHAYLFPHLSVGDNVTYGTTDLAYAHDIARRLGVQDLMHRPVHTLSGGERQLVALTRALAPRPPILLFDEPFVALDPRRRSVVRREVRAIHREIGATMLQVTHDFTEAGLLGDVAVLLDRGRVLQSGPPEVIFRAPASADVAGFLGVENIYAGSVSVQTDGTVEFHTSNGALTFIAHGDATPGPGHAVVRADEIVLSPTATASSARNVFHGYVETVERAGALTRVTVMVDGTPLVAALTTRSASDLQLDPGTPIIASFKAMAVHLC